MMNFLSDRRGNIAIIAALGIPVFAGGLALGTEAAYWLVQKSQLAATTDAISISALKLREKSVSVDQIKSILKASMTANGYPAETAVDVTYPDAQSVTVNTTFPAQKYFSSAVFMGSVDITATATIRTSGGQQVCLLALSTTKPDAFSMAGNASATLISCVAASNSTISLGNATDIAAECLYAVGSINGINSSTDLDCPLPTPNQPVVPDPLASMVRPVSATCGKLPDPKKKGLTTHVPGCYNSNTDLKGAVTFSPGVYIFENTDLKINANATINGTGVTFVLKGSSTLNFNGTATIRLSAPSGATAPYKGILFFGANTGARDHKINGNSSSSLTGTVYLPKDNITFTGNSGLSPGCLRLVADTIEMTGSTEFNSDCTGVFGPNDPKTAASLRIIQ